MKKQEQATALSTLSSAYKYMYDHVSENLHKVSDTTGPLLHDLIDEAKEKGENLDDLTEEEIANISQWLKRDLDDVLNYLSETDYAVRDWLGFETSIIKTAMIHMMLDVADKTTVELLRMEDNAGQPASYHTGEVTGVGTLICDECAEKLHFHNVSHIPPCPKCHKTAFHRIQIE